MLFQFAVTQHLICATGFNLIENQKEGVGFFLPEIFFSKQREEVKKTGGKMTHTVIIPFSKTKEKTALNNPLRDVKLKGKADIILRYKAIRFNFSFCLLCRKTV